MNEDRRRFDPAEIADGDGAAEAGVEAELLRAARDLEAFAGTGTSAPSPEFEDRVMRAIADEPAPRLAVGRGVGFLTTIRDAWRVAWSGSRPLALRAQALALLLMVAVAAGSLGSVAVVGASRLLSPDGPSPSEPPTPPPTPVPSPTAIETPSPSPSPSATPSPRPSPTETAEPTGTDDHGGSSGSGSSGSGSGGSGTRTPRPTETPDRNETPHPDDTPEPDETPRPTD